MQFDGNTDWAQYLLPAMVPVFFISYLIEMSCMRKVPGHAADFSSKVFATNLGLGLSYLIVDGLLNSLYLQSFFAWLYGYRIFTLEITWWNVLPLFLAVEFCYYWSHRAAHRIRWFWTGHVPHHSGEHMSFSTAIRQSMLGPVIGGFVFFMPLMYLGLNPRHVGVMLSINLIYQFYIHTNLIKKFPDWVEFIFNTPSHHRAHHGKNPQYIDKNYGGTLIIFDRLFGTFEPEVEAPVYGITRQVKSCNPLLLNFHELMDMIKDLRRPGPLNVRLKHLWGPPEWVRPGNDSI